MKPFLRIALALSAVGLAPLHALAADYDPPIYVDEAPEYQPVEVGSGWYLRGDVSYLPDETYKNRDFSSSTVSYSDRERPIFGSIGFGYHFNDYLRGDINFGLLPGNEASASETTATDIASGRIENSARTAIVNGYVDLGTYVGITPYVGAGLGVFQGKYEARSNFNDLTPADLDTSDSVRKTQYSWAYTLNAGLAYQITKNVVIDLGYQYMSAPDAEYAKLDSAGSYSVHKGVDNHQIKVGLRYDLW